MPRFAATVVALLAAPLLLAGCGADDGDDGQAASDEARARAAAPIDPADPARAAAAPLTLKDLGAGWELEEEMVSTVGDTAPLTRELMTCADAQSFPVHSSAEAGSPPFYSDPLITNLDSEVTINRSEKETVDDFAVVEEKRFTDCVLEDGSLLPDDATADGDPTVTTRVVDGVGDRTVVHRVASPHVLQGQKIPDAAEYAFIRVGRAYAFVRWDPAADEPLPPRLLQVAASRLQRALDSAG